MSGDVSQWTGRPGKNELAPLLAIIDLMTDHIPQLRGELPFIDKTRRLSAQQLSRIKCSYLEQLWRAIQAHGTPSALQRRGGLSTCPRTLNQDGTHTTQQLLKDAVDGASKVLHE